MFSSEDEAAEALCIFQMPYSSSCRQLICISNSMHINATQHLQELLWFIKFTELRGTASIPLQPCYGISCRVLLDFQYVKPALLELQHLQLLRRRRLLFTRICYGKYSVLLLTWLISLSNTSPPLSRFLVFVTARTRVGRRGKVPRESILTTTWSNLKLEVETGNLWRFGTFRLRASLSLFSLSLCVLSKGGRRRV